MKKLLLLSGLIAAVFFTGTAFGAETAPAPTPPQPTLEQRVGGLEAYVGNTDPSAAVAALKDKDGNLPKGFAMPTLGAPGPGHNAWQMTSSALVLFMTLPGLALFYGGLVRRKNVLSVMAQCLLITGLVTILWWACGYSLVFHSGGKFLGSLDFKFLTGVDSTPNGDYSYWVSQNVYAMYQLMFAIITPALIIGAIAERMKFAAIFLFMILWMFIVYFPQAHMVWGIDGMMNGVWNAKASIKAMDFAGGTVVHMTAGWSALILCLILGKRIGFGKENMAPHSMVLCMIGTGMLWVGWYGFNAGSAVAADTIAANAFTTTTLATAVASFVWPMAEWLVRGKPSVLGFCSGALAGLVVITPACGFVNSTGAVIIGIAAGLIPWFFCYKVKSWFGYDDALDTFGVHAIGGTLGALMTGILADPAVNGNIALSTADPKNPATQNGLAQLVASHGAWLEQVKAIGVTLVLAIVGTTIIAFIVKAVIGLRPSEEVEVAGLDVAEHGEEGYHGASA
ncbi:MAG TPA: ammonium transporter [Verrucomicrobiae bacterium]|nr:ammonium transporter [Verrucomicrobiae bacterium]